MIPMYVVIALVIGASTGAVIVLIASRGQSRAVNRQILDQVQQIGAVLANAGQRGRAGEIALQNLLEASGLGQHRDFKLQDPLPGRGRPDVVLNLPGRGRLFIDAKFPLDDFQRAVSATTDKDRRKALDAHGHAVASHVAELAKRDYPPSCPTHWTLWCATCPAMNCLRRPMRPTPRCFTTRPGTAC
jgi:DNA recombination protein RmuC